MKEAPLQYEQHGEVKESLECAYTLKNKNRKTMVYKSS